MATPSGDTWTRNSLADENTDLTRKRQRLSEDTETQTSPLSSTGSAVVDTLPPDESGTGFDNAIELHDDADMASTTYTHGFNLEPHLVLSPTAQLQQVLNLLLSSNNIAPAYFVKLSVWLREHLNATKSGPVAVWQNEYTREVEFFVKLAELSVAILSHGGEVFRRIPEILFDQLGTSVVSFINDMATLGTRMVLILPPAIAHAIRRRDSGQIKSLQSVKLLQYLQVLAQVLALRGVKLAHFKDTFHLNPSGTANRQRELFLHNPSAPAALASVFEELADHHSDIDGAWNAIEATLDVIGALCLVEDTEAIDGINRAMATIQHRLLPAICIMSPRAVPIDVHELLVKMGCRMLTFMIERADLDESASLYEQYIKSDHDALFTETTKGSAATILETLSNGDSDTLLGLLRTAWKLQALRLYIFSSIMDVRSSGILQLSTLLLQLYNTLKTSEEGFEHPILQYVGRFMRTNELPKYIFGPESHASLISHSQNIIGFLAATFLYTDNETDLIWAACTTSVEAEFVKASFGVLTELCRYLDLDHLLYLVKKYAITPPDKLGKDAVDTLTDLFLKVQLKSGSAKDQDRRLTTAFISMEILFKVQAAEQTFSTAQLRDTARTELLRFTSTEYSPDDRFQIYKRCIPNLLEPNDRATTSIDIILLFLDSAIVCLNDAQDLLGMLSIGALVDELSYYVETRRLDNAQESEAYLAAIQSRINAIIRMQALSGGSESDSTWMTFSRYTTGKLALNNAVRDCAWSVFLIMSSFTGTVGTAAKDMLRHCLEAAVSLPVEFLTPTLLSIFGSELRQLAECQELKDDYCLILQTPIWQKLVQTAESTVFPKASSQARKIVCDVLFEYPLAYATKSKVARCHAEFSQNQISRIRTAYQDLECSAGVSEIQVVNQKIDLLAEVFRRSKLSGNTFEVKAVTDVVLATEPAAAVFGCQLQVYGVGNFLPKVYELHVKESTKLSELAIELPKITGAETNRVIIGGQSLDLQTQGNQQLSELGVRPASGVISICPKHTFQSDIEILLTPPGEVGKVLVAQFDELATLLDGPDDIARMIFTFITEICPPALQRQRVADDEQSIHDLFPPNKMWRSAFTIHLLNTQLQDYARLGVADERFRLHGVTLLVGIIGDETRQIEPVVFGRAMACLLSFLREQPPSLTTTMLIKSPSDFVSRMIDVCYFFLRYPSEHSGIRHSMVRLGFEAMIEAFRRQPSVWQSFTEEPRVFDIHQQVLMHSDKPLVTDITSMVKNFSADPTIPDHVTNFYMKIGIDMLPHVLKCRTPFPEFFALACDALLANRMLRNDEVRTRDLCEVLVTYVQTYEHSECVGLPLADTTMKGLLDILNAAIAVLRSFKKPLNMGGLSAHMFTSLLFPPVGELHSRPLVDRTSRLRVYDVVRATCETEADFACLLAATSVPMHGMGNNPTATFPGISGWHRPAWQCSGLTNLGMTCYMNSLLQQLFANVHFRKFIFDTPIKDRAKQELLFQVQYLFARMQDDYSPVSDTSELARALGIQIENQDDVHGFYEDFLNRLEASMPNEMSRRGLSRFFSGTLVSQIKGECGHVSPRTEPFVDLQMIVKNKTTLFDSLQELVQGEPMEGTNKYKCLSCDPTNGEGHLVNAMRRSCPENMPDNLTFCLKRFSFEAMYGHESKVNDRFEFPQTIDMSRWHLAHLDDPTADVKEDLFELVGVIVHQGSLQLGHYWSYTLIRNTDLPDSRTWIKLEDRLVSHCQGGIEEVQQECFGGLRNNGQERADNAYVLFYQRKEYLEEPISLPGPVRDPATSFILPAKVSVPTELQELIQSNNSWRNQTAGLFDDEFHNHIMWLLANFDYFLPASPSPPDCDSPMINDDQSLVPAGPEIQATDDFMKCMSEIATIYIQRVATCDATAALRLDRCVATLNPLIAAHPRLATHVLGQVTRDKVWLGGVIAHTSQKIRLRILDFVLHCLEHIREHDGPCYKNAFNQIVKVHSDVKEQVDPTQFHWEYYLVFALALGAPGPWERASILDNGYLAWALNVLYTLVVPEQQDKLPNLVDYMEKNPMRVNALFDFIFNMVNASIVILDHTPQENTSEFRHQITDDGIVLDSIEVELLFRGYGGAMWMSCAKFADWSCDWRDFAPGKLISLLMSSPYPQQLKEIVTASFEKHIHSEETVLDSVMHLLLHFCASASEEDATAIFHTMAMTIHGWTRAELTFLHVVREAHKLTPLAVVSSLEHWVAKYLSSTIGAVREGTEKWLMEAIFKPEPISDYQELDTSRVRQVRTLLRVCRPLVKDAYDKEEPKTKYESTINTLLNAEMYLEKLKMAGKTAGQSTDEAIRALISKPLSFELAELQMELQELKAFRKMAQDWEAEDPLPISRRSIELESEEETDDSEIYEDYEDGSVSPR